MWSRLKVAVLFVYHGIDSPQFRAAARAFIAATPATYPIVKTLILELLNAMEADDVPAAVQAVAMSIPQGNTQPPETK